MKATMIIMACLLALSDKDLLAQCSDAGVCSIGHPIIKRDRRVSVVYQYGKSSKTDNLTFHSIAVSADLQVLKDSRLYVSLPYSGQSGPLGSAKGIGDLTVLWSQRILDETSSQLSVQLGGKLSIGETNNGGLPQRYQSGLGTNDALVGITYQLAEWSFAVAYQLSRGRSDNRITRLSRCDDLLLKGGYTYETPAFTLGGDVLFIKRLAESSVITSMPDVPEMFGVLPGSDQTQINVLGRGSYALSEIISLDAAVALPLLKREINVDGLTRSITVSSGISILF